MENTTMINKLITIFLSLLIVQPELHCSSMQDFSYKTVALGGALVGTGYLAYKYFDHTAAKQKQDNIQAKRKQFNDAVKQSSEQFFSKDKNQGLLEAATDGNISHFNAWMQKGADVNCVDDDGQPVATRAVLSGNHILLEKLLEYEQIDLLISDRRGKTAWAYASDQSKKNKKMFDVFTTSEIYKKIMQKDQDELRKAECKAVLEEMVTNIESESAEKNNKNSTLQKALKAIERGNTTVLEDILQPSKKSETEIKKILEYEDSSGLNVYKFVQRQQEKITNELRQASATRWEIELETLKLNAMLVRLLSCYEKENKACSPEFDQAKKICFSKAKLAINLFRTKELRDMLRKNPYMRCYTDEAGNTLLLCAIKQERLEAVNILLAGLKYDELQEMLAHKNNDGKTAMDIAEGNQNIKNSLELHLQRAQHGQSEQTERKTKNESNTGVIPSSAQSLDSNG